MSPRNCFYSEVIIKSIRLLNRIESQDGQLLLRRRFGDQGRGGAGTRVGLCDKASATYDGGEVSLRLCTVALYASHTGFLARGRCVEQNEERVRSLTMNPHSSPPHTHAHTHTHTHTRTHTRIAPSHSDEDGMSERRLRRLSIVAGAATVNDDDDNNGDGSDGSDDDKEMLVFRPEEEDRIDGEEAEPWSEDHAKLLYMLSLYVQEQTDWREGRAMGVEGSERRG